MNTKAKIAVNVAVKMGTRIIAAPLGIFVIYLLTHYLGKEAYGQYVTAISFIQIAATVSVLGLGATMVRFMSDERRKERHVPSAIYTLSIITGILFAVLTPLLASLFPYDDKIVLVIAIGSVAILSNSVRSVLNGIFVRHLASWNNSLLEVSGRFLFLAGIFMAVTKGYGILAVMAVKSITDFLQALGARMLSAKYTLVKLHLNVKTWKEAINDSWPFAVLAIMETFRLNAAIIMISIALPEAQAALYGAPLRLFSAVKTVPMAFIAQILPLLTRSWSKGKLQDMKRKIELSFSAIALISFPVAFGTLVTGEDLMVLIAGEEFASSGIILTIIMFKLVVLTFGLPCTQTLNAMGLQHKLLKFSVFDIAMTLILYATLIPRFGLKAAAIIYALSGILSAAACLFIIAKKIQIRADAPKLFRLLLASILMSLAIWLLPEVVHVLLKIAFGALVYVALVFLLRAAPNKEIREIFGGRPDLKIGC